MKWALAGTVVLLAIVAILVAAIFSLQRRMLFPGPFGPVGGPPEGIEVIRLALPGGPVEALYLPPLSAVNGQAPLILFSHGNGELADDWVDGFDEPRRWGWAVLLLEYPGYGRSAGTPAERAVFAVSEAAYAWARADARVDATRLVTYGRSLGGGPAARLAVDRALPAVILESAFTSVAPFAAQFFLPRFLVRDPFDSLTALVGYRGGLLVLHGRADEIIPVSHGRELAAAVPGATFHELPCGHNDCPRPWPQVARFFDSLGLPSDARGR